MGSIFKKKGAISLFLRAGKAACSAKDSEKTDELDEEKQRRERVARIALIAILTRESSRGSTAITVSLE